MSGSRARQNGLRLGGRRADQARRHAALPGTLWAALLVAMLLVHLPAPAAGQTGLGSQRVGTSSGAFLKIPVDARSSALAGATGANIRGPAALYVNPAGIGLEADRAVQVSAIRYVTDIPMGGIAACLPVPAIGGSVGFSFRGLFAEMDETDEFHPLGTGRSFSYTTWVAVLGASRALTDKLSFGLSAKVLYEGYGTEVGGPSSVTYLADAGAIYYVGYRDARIGIAVNDFGADLRPDGEFVSNRDGTGIRYSSFSPPTQFRMSFSIDPYVSGTWQLLTMVEIGHVADNQEAVRIGGEATFRRILSLRGGYDFFADALNLHAGFGVRLRSGETVYELDYAYSDGGAFGTIHRWSLEVPW